jgi:nucleotide-binding universal stress UspA family protein
MQFEHIVVGVDFSETSREALRIAARLASNSATCRLVLVHVWHRTHPYASSSGDELRAAVEADEGQMKELEVEAKGIGAPHVESVFLAGNPADEIIELAHKDDSIDLIVMGTHGRTGLSHVLLGSVAEKVVRRAPCAVMAIPLETARSRRRPARPAASVSIH